MAGPFGSPFGGGFSTPFNSPFGSSSSNPDDVFRKQMESMAKTLASGGVNVEPVDQRTWLEKFFNVLNRPLGATTSLISGFTKPGSDLGQGARQALDVITGKKTYGAKELLDDSLGKSDSFGRKAAAFALGIPLDPLTWIPLSKIAKPLLGASAKGIRTAGFGEKLDQAGEVASGVKKFFGYDDFARFGPKAEKSVTTMVDGVEKKVITQAAQPDLRDVMRNLTQLVQSDTGRTGLYLDEYKQGMSSLFKALKLTPEAKDQFLRAIEQSKTSAFKLKAGEVLAPEVESAVFSFQKVMKELGDQQAKLGLIKAPPGADFVKAGLPERIGGETSKGYIKHVLNPEFKAKYPTLESVPKSLQSIAKPFYEVGSSRVYSRKLDGSLLDNNLTSQLLTGGTKVAGSKEIVGGIKMFEDDPIKILERTIEDLSHTKAQIDIVKKIKKLKDPTGKSLFDLTDDKTIENLQKTLAVTKTKGGVQPFIRSAGTDIEDGLRNWLESNGMKYDDVIGSVPLGKVASANPEIAAILNKLSAELPPEEANPILKNIDKITTMWKKLAITNPKFHINNWFGANANNLIDDAKGTIKNSTRASTLIKDGTSKILKEFRESGASSGFTKAEVFPKNILDAVSKVSGAVGGKIEEHARLTAYLNALDRGMTKSEALQRVFQIHGNYNPTAMSGFEKDVVKRFIPFYTWAKTSAPYQVQSLWNKTGIYSNLAHSQDIVANQEDRKGIPDWLRSRILLSTNKNKDGTSTARQLPLSIPDLEMFSDPAKVFLSKLNPLLKIPIEVGQNRGTFFGETLFDKNKYNTEGEKVPMSAQVLDYISKQIPAYW